MTTTRLLRAAAAATALCAAFALTASPASADAVQGKGSALITKDAETVRSLARAEAKRDLVRAMLAKSIGRDRIAEIAPDILQDLADQIAPDMITSEMAERQGNQFLVSLSADIDQAFFRQLMGDAGIDSSSQRADGNRALILVYLDREEGLASDFSQPAEVETDYTRQTGASYSDHSTVTASSKEAAASSSRRASASSRSDSGASRTSASGAYSQRVAGSYAGSGPGGSEAARVQGRSSGGFSGNSANGYSSRASSASASKSSSAYSASSSFADRTAVDAEVHDNVSFHQRVLYQKPPQDADSDLIMNALSQGLKSFDVETGSSWPALAGYFKDGVPRYGALKRSREQEGFLRSLASRNTPFFLGGTFVVSHAGRDPMGNAVCTGRLDGAAFATADGRNIGAAIANAEAVGSTPEACSGKLAEMLAAKASTVMGKQIQDSWRKKAVANTGIDSSRLNTYSLMLRAPNMDMAMQADLMDALTAIPGVQGSNFVSQSTTELRVNVGYAGTQPLQFAIFQKLRDKPAFATMRPTVEGASITLCIAICQ